MHRGAETEHHNWELLALASKAFKGEEAKALKRRCEKYLELTKTHVVVVHPVRGGGSLGTALASCLNR